MGKAKCRWAAELGYDPVYGTRLLKRLLQGQRETQLIETLIAGDVPDGANVSVTTDG